MGKTIQTLNGSLKSSLGYAAAGHSHTLASLGAFPAAGGSLSGPITGETMFVGGNLTYSDPWNGTACALKVTGKIACTDTIKAPTFEGNATTASSATKLTNARTLTIGNTGKTFNGSDNVSWSLSEIGAADLVQMGVNKILFERFSRGSIDGTNPVIESDLIGKSLLDSTLINDFGSFGAGDNYLGRLTTHLYFSAATEWTTIASSDDGSTIYLNEQAIATLQTCIETSVTFNFVKGWNKIVWIFNEGAGGDSATFNPSIKTVSNLTYMNAYPVAFPGKVHQSYKSDTATTANTLSTARTLTIGNAGKSFDGSANASWSLSEIGAASTSHNHVVANITDLRIKNVASSITTAPPVQTWANANIKNNDIIFGGDYGGHSTTDANIVFSSNVGKINMVIDGEYYAMEGQHRVYHPGNKPTLNELGAAAASHGTHVTYATAAPNANGTAAVGSSSKVAREDHVHPLQTSVSGNAGSATKLATARTLTIGNTGKSFDGSANVSWSLSEIGALPTTGGDVTGNIKVTNDSYLEWNRNTDYARISFKNTGDGDTDSYMYFLAGDNGDEYFKFSSLSGSTTTDLLTIKTDHLRFKGNNVYHTGNKPTPGDIGAATSGHTHSNIINQDTRDVNTTPDGAPLGLSVHLKNNGADGLSDGGLYHSSFFIKGWNDYSGGPYGNLAITANNNLWFRASSSGTAWSSWKKVSVDGHTHSYLPLSGGTMTGKITTPNGAPGITIGDDITLCDRNQANMLILEGSNAESGGIIFGSGLDTNIYRGGANLLKTDDTFNAVGGFQWNGQSLDSRYAAATTTGSLSSLQTSEKGSLVAAINEVFQNANNGKQLIANAIGNSSITANSTFSAMSEAISGLRNGVSDIIIAASLPSSANEGQLCIITNTSTDKVTISRDKPTLTESEIYIKCYDTPSFYEYTIKSGKAYVKVNIRYIVQYVNGAEVSLLGYIYSGGNWVPLIPNAFYLFKVGVGVDSSVSYDHNVTATGINITTANSKQTVTVNTSLIKMQTRSASGCYPTGTFTFKNINLTGFDYLHIDFESSSTSNNLGSTAWNINYAGIKLQICDLSGTVISTKTFKHTYNDNSYVWKISRQVYKFDIASLNGEYNIKIINELKNPYADSIDIATKVYDVALGPEVLPE